MYTWDEYFEDVNTRYINGDTKLHKLCINPLKSEYQRNLVELLLESGIDTNTRNDQLVTPLHYAAYYGDIMIVSLLIYHDSIINVIDRYSHSPLEYAIMAGNNDIANFLISYGAYKRW
jgi:ankyrin repeat protein